MAKELVEIVRCKDCVHRPNKNGCGPTIEEQCEGLSIEVEDNTCPCICYDYYYSYQPQDDWFCANGEEKNAGD